jgi:hypothetical protein
MNYRHRIGLTHSEFRYNLYINSTPDRKRDSRISAAVSVEDLSMKLAVPDLISNSYFPAAAAVELVPRSRASASRWS